jgi:hypothetical protein
MGPESYAITELEVSKLKTGDIAGLALLNLPYAWIGILKNEKGQKIQFYNQQEQKLLDVETQAKKIFFRAHCNFDTDTAELAYSFDGINFTEIGGSIVMPYQLRTFQGVRYALFSYNTYKVEGGYADFNSFKVIEPRCKGLTRPIPYNQVITLKCIGDGSILVNWRNHVRPVEINSNFARGNASHFKVIDKGNGRIALQSLASGGFVTVKGVAGLAEVRIEAEEKGDASVFQWEDMLKGDLMLMSLYNHRYLSVDPFARSLCYANATNTQPDRKDGACFVWEIVAEK